MIDNTLFFLKGLRANNVLLYGDRGTGKSSTVKALLNEYCDEGLRMIEVPKACLSDLPLIIEEIKDKPHKFILFIDDLAFVGQRRKLYCFLMSFGRRTICKIPECGNICYFNRRHLLRKNS
jgi:predicted AAA+ superfamily ATPase